MLKIVIRAGGTGTRLWPKSRQNSPKQLSKLIGSRTMLQETVDRVVGFVKYSDIFISTNKKLAKEVKRQVPKIPSKNIIVEPDKRDTAAAIGLESIYIRKRFPGAVIASLGSDHLIKSKKNFLKTLDSTYKLVSRNPKYLTCIAVYPTYPDTGYGYIKLDKVVDSENHEELYEVNKFIEKPRLRKAKKFVKDGNYLWNGNMFMWKADTILNNYQKLLPGIYKKLQIIEKAIDTKDENKVLEKIYPKFRKISVDNGIMEKADNVAAISLEAGWSDIGDWSTLKDELVKGKNNLVEANHMGIDTENTLVYGDKKKLIATVGIENLVVVDTDNALLICDKNRAQEVKKIVEKLEKKNEQRYL
ncbi:MAG: mannose-1-phosphate guanylyltransferase [Parcubacteria group bacterium]|nr:mannose-1-phosphate guanylyltransferase [Parcubacteria group bacterium]